MKQPDLPVYCFETIKIMSQTWSRFTENTRLWLVFPYKKTCPKNVKSISITFTFVSQFAANFEIEFLIVYRDCWLTLMFQKEIRFLIYLYTVLKPSKSCRKPSQNSQRILAAACILHIKGPVPKNVKLITCTFCEPIRC